jgi:type II secretory pathway component PulF
MATYVYQGRLSNGKRERGVVTADSGRQARELLRRRGCRVESIQERQVRTADSHSFFQSRRIRHRAKLTMSIRELSTLLQAGIPLLSALDSLVQQSTGSYRDCLVALRDRVGGGSGLAEAMSAEPTVFDQMTVGMIRVGEHAGNLDEVCEQLAEFRERSGEVGDRILSAILYPAIVLFVSIAVTIFLMTVVVPMLLTNLVEMGRPLPWPTRVLKAISDTLLAHGWWLATVIAFCAACFAMFLRSEVGRKQAARIMLRVPVAGTLIQRQVLSRMALVVSSLLKSGVELVDALRIAERSANSVLLQQALREMRSDLESGRGMLESMRRHAIFSHSVQQVFLLGQQSGKLATMLERIGRDYDRQAAVLSGRLTSVVEPVLILVLAVIVGFVLFATVLPILEAGNVLGE